MKNTQTTRRDFLRKAGAIGAAGAVAGCAKDKAAAPVEVAAVAPAPKPEAVRRVIGANDRVRCAFVGVGGRGSSLLSTALRIKDIEPIAICDTYDSARMNAADKCKQVNPNIKNYIKFEEMFEAENLDAVVIATPDHLHASVIMAALDRKIDVYCEKPMTFHWEDAKAIRNCANETGAIVQIGTQLRSTDIYNKAREIAQSGELGKLIMVQVNRNAWDGMATYNKPPEGATAENTHWPLFVRDTKEYPFDARRYFQWRLFEDYSNGVTGDLMLHHLDICQYISGCGMAERVMSVGGIYHYHDGRTVHDTMSALVKFPEDFHFNYTTTLVNGKYGLEERYLFSDGTIEFSRMNTMTVSRKSNAPEEVVTTKGLDTLGHIQNWVDSIRSRKQPVTGVEAGMRGAILCRMAMQSQVSGQAAQWDSANEAVVMG
ncbi:MAG: dehydrogenase [Candidatus Hydrogenedentota bacterium]